jgi:hypothetical protein
MTFDAPEPIVGVKGSFWLNEVKVAWGYMAGFIAVTLAKRPGSHRVHVLEPNSMP